MVKLFLKTTEAVEDDQPGQKKGSRKGNCRNLRWVKNAPVNYAMRFSGPVTALTARRVRYGV
jgi:hypothetical protein